MGEKNRGNKEEKKKKSEKPVVKGAPSEGKNKKKYE